MDNAYLEKIPLSEDVDDKIMGSSRSTEVRKLGESFVLKELGAPYSLQKDNQESSEEYSERRVKMCLKILNNEKKLAETAANYIPDQVKTYTESYLICKGKDGFPAPFKVQEVVKGKTLREQPGIELSDGLKEDLDKVVEASVKCFFKTGKVFDLVGSVGGDGEGVWEAILKHLNPKRYAANLMVSEDNKLVFVDARVSGDSLIKQIASLVTLAGYYWEKHRQIIEDKSL